MSTTRYVIRLCLMLVVLAIVLTPVYASETIKGLVVDRTDQYVWLGLPGPAQKGTLFNIYLMPGDSVIATSRVVDSTADSPFVARATYKLANPKGFLPVGSYAESVEMAVPDTDQYPGYKAAAVSHWHEGRLRFQTGVLLLPDNQLSRETSTVWPMLQITESISLSDRLDLLAGVGYIWHDGNFTVTSLNGARTNGHRNFFTVPLTLDAIANLGNRDMHGNWYVRAGVGAYIISDERRVGSSSTDDEFTRFGWRAGLGYQLRGRGFAEVYYMGVDDTDLQGVAFNLGARF